MREIKFRAWNKIAGKIQPVICLWMQEGEIRHIATTSETDECITLFDNDYEVMQYTGLKDKNGKEIYEGDLVKVYSEVVREVVFKNAFWQMEEREMVAANVLGGFGTAQEESHKPLYRYPERDIEVIGNIYENPELLNSDKNDKWSVATGGASSNADDKIEKENYEYERGSE